ncbi:MAG: hypothetical protein RI560_04785, partial [Natronomonas sp.]|nr:hypothetical protein [Natronomonas sp.]
TGETVVETARERPGVIVGGLAAGAALSVGSGLAIGRGVRGATGRVRTAGGTRIDAGDIVNRDTRRVFDDGEAGDRFPPFRDEELARSDPAEAVRKQADEFTPDELEATFDEAGATEGSVLFKALDTEPAGPESGRAARGLRTQEGGFESPGAFVGPELSPNFLRLSTERGFSARPGLPDTGGRPTAVAVRTDVDAPDADTLGEFNQELLDRSGETTARTKPSGEVNVGEAEAVIPGDATFRDVGGGPVRNTLRRVGVGSDFYTEIGGQRVPIRTVAPEADDAQPRSLLGDTRGQVRGGRRDRAAFSGELREFGRAPRAPVDRPTPVAGAPIASGIDTEPTPTRDPTGTTTTSDPFDADSDTSPTSTRSAIDLEPSSSPPTSSTRSDSGGESSGGGTSGSRRPSRPSASDPIGVPSGSSPGGSSSSGGSPASGGSPSPPGSPPGSPASPGSPGSPLGPPSNAPPSTGPPSTRTGRPPRRDSDRPDDDLSVFSSDEEEFIKRFEFGVASPGEVLAGDELDTAAGDADAIDEDLDIL